MKIEGGATERVLKELSKLRDAYKITKCYILRNNRRERIECSSLANKLLSGAIHEVYEVCNERVGKCYSIGSGSYVKHVDITGHNVYLIKDELESVEKGERIGYVVTNKGEVRTVRSPYRGKIILIHEVLGEKFDHYIVFVEVIGDG